MEQKMSILEPFFDDPEEGFHIREVSRLTGINHTTVRTHLSRLADEGFLEVKKGKPYPFFKAARTKRFLNLKLYRNLERLRESGLIGRLETEFDYPVIVIFGSYAHATDGKDSDVDLCVISTAKKEPDLKPYEESLGRQVSLHDFSEKEWKSLIRKRSDLVNSISNGIVLSGELEVVDEV